ncbi:MAG: class I SAM-dependent methyltransferase [Clostridia bacterium]|nr:class I SAM-dependent methyltransferase [Clostridia bacterium]
MEAYSGFAQVYDFLMKDVDYDGWVDYIEEIFISKGCKPQTILELACGTGNITNRLSKRGYDIVGIDISNEMLALAKNKAYDLRLDIKYLNQDMRQLNYSKKADSVICMCDGFNYILEENDLLSVLEKVYSLLKEDGVLIFDISSYHKLSEVLGNNVYAENFEDISYIWQNYFDYETNLCELGLTIFKRQDRLFSRYQEYHYQRAYRVEEILEILKYIGFINICVYRAFSFEKIQYKDDRVFFVCKK